MSSTVIKIPLNIFRLAANAGARLILLDLYAHVDDQALVDYLAGRGPVPFSTRTVEELSREHDYSRSQVHRALKDLARLGQLRRGARVVDGAIVRGFELTPSAPVVPPAVRSSAPDGPVAQTVPASGSAEAEAVVDAIFAARAELGIRTPPQRPMTAADVALVRAPLARLGVSWEAWGMVIRRCADEVRRQAAADGGNVRRAASLPYLTLSGLAGANFARYLNLNNGT